MYFRYKRLSLYFGLSCCWLRVRTADMMPRGFLLQIGKEA